jgi:hypothetical protein
VNAINAGPTSKKGVEALRAALAQTDVRATALSAGVVTTLEAGSMVVDAYFYNSLPRARTWWTPAPSLTLVVPLHMAVYVRINLESPSAEVSDGRSSLPRTCNVRAAKAAGAVHVHGGVHAAIVEACRDSRARSRRLRVDFDVGHSRAKRTRGRLRSGATHTDGDASRLSRVRAVPGSERGTAGKRAGKPRSPRNLVCTPSSQVHETQSQSRSRQCTSVSVAILMDSYHEDG